MIAASVTKSIQQLVDVYVEIGEALGNLEPFHSLIKTDSLFQDTVATFFDDILNFHRCVLDVFSRPGSFTLIYLNSYSR